MGFRVLFRAPFKGFRVPLMGFRAPFKRSFRGSVKFKKIR